MSLRNIAICGVLGFGAAIAVNHHMESSEDSCSDNPWASNPATTPQGPFVCPFEMYFDPEKVAEAEAAFAACADAAQTEAFGAWAIGCASHRESWDNLNDQFESGHISMDEMLKGSLEANDTWDQQQTQIETQFWSKISDCAGAFYTAMDNACTAE